MLFSLEKNTFAPVQEKMSFKYGLVGVALSLIADLGNYFRHNGSSENVL
jgi:hypothetical protein